MAPLVGLFTLCICCQLFLAYIALEKASSQVKTRRSEIPNNMLSRIRETASLTLFSSSFWIRHQEYQLLTQLRAWPEVEIISYDSSAKSLML